MFSPGWPRRGLLLIPLATALLAAACSAPAGGGTPAAGSGAAAATGAAPKVNRVVLALGAPGGESNTPNQVTSTDTWQIRPAYEYLTGVDTDGKDVQQKVPQLATEWSLEPDGKSYRFKLRKGVQFHYGMGEFTAQDVVFAWQHMIAPESKHPHTPRYRTTIEDVQVVNDYEVVFKNKQADLAFIWALGEMEGGFEINSKKDFDAHGGKWPALNERAIAGTGPYAIAEREQARYMRFKAVENHYRHTPDFPEFEFRFIKENSTRLAALLSREIQLAALPFEATSQAEKSGMKVIRGRGPVQTQTWVQFYGPWANVRVFADEQLNADPNAKYVYPNTPLLDVRVRKALSKAINRDELNKAFFQGKGDPIYNLFFHPSRPGWNAEWEKRFKDEYGYDPEAAKKLLAEAGYGPGNPLKHTLLLKSYGYYPELSDMTDSIMNYWRSIGVEVTLDQSDAAIQSTKARQLSYDNHSYLVPSSVRQFYGYGIYQSGTTGGRAGAEFVDTRDFFQNKLRPALDDTNWDALWRELGNMTYDAHQAIPLFLLPAQAVVDPTVVSDYQFSGTLTGTYTNVEYIKPAR